MVKRDLYTRLIITALLIGALILLRIYVFEPIRIHNNNMAPALTKSEQVLALKKSKLENLDLVAYRNGDKKYIGRVIGIPGQEVTMFDDILYIDGKIIKEPYIKKNETAFLKENPDEEYNADFSVSSLTGKNIQKLPKDKYIILNDNRKVFDDSRKFGLIDKSDIYGRITFKVFPLKDFGFVQNDEAKFENGFKVDTGGTETTESSITEK
ncbi:signal peptidase I [Floricoccus penangensis]|uniref:Signal peptidase I n=1 Tax=Floricoccus penangensis TaxID=1859475 RepID=A0A9Q5JHP4_9LACT|nr:signal peptidase I [Floricoccus penangensis]OFI47768.1 signal peptidase I [Floricoccus penangensis]